MQMKQSTSIPAPMLAAMMAILRIGPACRLVQVRMRSQVTQSDHDAGSRGMTLVTRSPCLGGNGAPGVQPSAVSLFGRSGLGPYGPQAYFSARDRCVM